MYFTHIQYNSVTLELVKWIGEHIVKTTNILTYVGSDATDTLELVKWMGVHVVKTTNIPIYIGSDATDHFFID